MHAAVDAPDNLQATLEGIRKAADQPFDKAITMPPRAYTCEQVLALEQQKIFATQWVCVGRVEEVANVGDYFVTRVADEPLIIVRSQADTILALSNVCRHKWTQLLEGRGSAQRIVCPYHAWTYDLQGTLVHARFMDKSCGFKAEEHCLPRVACDSWRGFVYVRIEGDDNDLHAQLAGLDARTFDYHMEDMRLICSGDEIWASNWKLLAENFTETYHVFHTHRESIERYTPTQSTIIMDGDAAHSFGVNPLLKEAMTESPFEPFHPELSERHQRQFCMIGLFPNQMIALAPDRFFYMCLTPVGADKVRLKWAVCSHDHQADEQTRRGIEGIYTTINGEDKLRLERIQTSLGSRFAEQGPISCYEKMNWEFTRYLAGHLC